MQKLSPTSALFTWQVPTGTQIEYLVITITGSNGGSTGLTMLGDATSLTLIDLAPGVTYTFSMQAWNIYGGGAGSYAAPVTAQVAGPPVGPSTSQLLHAYPVADNRRVLSDLLVSKNNMVFSTGELIVGCNWFMNTFLWVQNSICYSSAIRFDVSALAGKTVTQAQLWLKPSYPAASPDTNYSVSAIATSWSASALTGLTDLQLYAAGESMVAAPTSFSPIGFNVTQIVQNWASGAWSNSGFLLQDVSYVFPYSHRSSGRRRSTAAITTTAPPTIRRSSGSSTTRKCRRRGRVAAAARLLVRARRRELARELLRRDGGEPAQPRGRRRTRSAARPRPFRPRRARSGRAARARRPPPRR